MNADTQVLLQGLTIIGSGLIASVGAYIGVKVALAEMRTTQGSHSRDIADHDERLKYLERSGRHDGQSKL